MPRDPGSSATSLPGAAAGLARETVAIRLTPALEVVLREAARLWCRDQVFPTARRLARSIGRAPSTVLNGFETMPRIHAELIRREWGLLRANVFSPDRSDWVPWLLAHIRALDGIDRTMIRLPSLVCAAVDANAQRSEPRLVSSVSIALSLIAAFAEPSIVLPSDAHLRRIILAASSANVGRCYET